jgi:hypothetical protein
MRYLFIALTTLLIWSCDENDPINLDKKYWLIDVNDGGLVTIPDGETDVKSHVRMVVRSTYDGKTPEGNWDLSIDQYTFMDLTENVQDEQIIEGYYSGKNYYTSVKLDIDKYTLPIYEENNKLSYFFGSETQKMSFFMSVPGPYYYKVLGDDGTTIQIDGSQLFMTSFPESIKMEFAGSSNENITTVHITFNMLAEEEISSTSLSVYGSVYSFGTETERDEWLQLHPLVNYLENPQAIPFR